jgi:aspartate oxidase
MEETAQHIKTMDEVQGERDTKALERRVQKLEELMSDTISILRSNWTLPASMAEFENRERE